MVLVKPLIKYDHLGEIIKPPSSYEEIWTDEGSGVRQDGSFWRVHAPPGFVALGDVACNNWSQPTPEFTAKYACIRQDCFLLMLNCLPQLCGTTVAPEQSDMFHSGPCKAITSQLDVLKPIEHTTNHLWKFTRYQLPRYTVRNAPITNS